MRDGLMRMAWLWQKKWDAWLWQRNIGIRNVAVGNTAVEVELARAAAPAILILILIWNII